MIKTLKKIDYHIAIWGLIAIALALVVGGKISMLSAAAGALLGMFNWMVFRNLAVKFATSGNQMGLSLFLTVKFLLLISIISLLLLLTPIQPIPFAAGISALFFGVSSGYVLSVVKDDAELKGEK